jgi:hypothetical protein
MWWRAVRRLRGATIVGWPSKTDFWFIQDWNWKKKRRLKFENTAVEPTAECLGQSAVPSRKSGSTATKSTSRKRRHNPAMAMPPLNWPFDFPLSTATFALATSLITASDDALWATWTACLHNPNFQYRVACAAKTSISDLTKSDHGFRIATVGGTVVSALLLFAARQSDLN